MVFGGRTRIDSSRPHRPVADCQPNSSAPGAAVDGGRPGPLTCAPTINALTLREASLSVDTGAYAESYNRAVRAPPFRQVAAHAWPVGTRKGNDLEGGGMIRSQQAGDVRRGNRGIAVATPGGTP